MCLWYSSHGENEAELLVGLMKSMRNDETTWKLSKAVFGTQVVIVHWQRLDQHVLQYIALDRLDVVFGAMLLKREGRFLIGHRVIRINHQYRDNPPQFDCYMVAECAGDATKRLSTRTAGALMHGDHWMEERSVMRKVRAASSDEAEFHGLGTGEVTRLLSKHICREDREQTKILVAYFDSMASHMEQQLGASESCNDKVKWLWMRQGIDKMELWTLTNLIGMHLVAGVECLVQQPREKITGTIPDREKRNCQRGFESLETIDGGRRHEGNRSSIVEGVAGRELTINDLMKWWSQGHRYNERNSCTRNVCVRTVSEQ